MVCNVGPKTVSVSNGVPKMLWVCKRDGNAGSVWFQSDTFHSHYFKVTHLKVYKIRKYETMLRVKWFFQELEYDYELL